MAAPAGLQGAYLLERISYLIAQIETTIASIMQNSTEKSHAKPKTITYNALQITVESHAFCGDNCNHGCRG